MLTSPVGETAGDQIRDGLVVRGEELGFGEFPGGGQYPILSVASLKSILSSMAVDFCDHDDSSFATDSDPIMRSLGTGGRLAS
jgi:hypothetical protein